MRQFNYQITQLPDYQMEASNLGSSLDTVENHPHSRLRFDQRILLLALAAGFPAALVALILLWTGDYQPKVQWTLSVVIIGVWAGCSSVSGIASCCHCRRCRTSWQRFAKAISRSAPAAPAATTRSAR